MKKFILLTLAIALLVSCAKNVEELNQDDLMLKGAKIVAINVPGDFPTIQEAIDDVSVYDGAVILVGPGNFAGAMVTKSVTIKGTDETIINDGPSHWTGKIQGFRFLTGSDGAIISHLTFEEVDFALMNGAAVNNVTVSQCTFNNSIQAISNWGGSNWEITHNIITDLRTDCGGGIGILIADYSGGVVEDNLVSHNKISGTLHVPDGDCGGYGGSGIVIYSDSRWDRLGAQELKNNRILHNKVSLFSNNPELVNVAAFELTDAANDKDVVIILDNKIGFNDFRGTEVQIVLTPDNLDEYNVISRNLGENRGHGVHPSVFR